jgi:hypothetical protein
MKFSSAKIAFSFAKQCIRNADRCTPEGWTVPSPPSYWRRQALKHLNRALKLRKEHP